MSARIWSITCWKIVAAGFTPNGYLRYAKIPKWVFTVNTSWSLPKPWDAGQVKLLLSQVVQTFSLPLYTTSDDQSKAKGNDESQWSLDPIGLQEVFWVKLIILKSSTWHHLTTSVVETRQEGGKWQVRVREQCHQRIEWLLKNVTKNFFRLFKGFSKTIVNADSQPRTTYLTLKVFR